MNEEDTKAFEDWLQDQWELRDSEYTRIEVTPETVWQAACEYKDKQYNPYGDSPDWVQEAMQRQATIETLKEQLAARDAVIVDVTEKLVGCMSSVKSELANFERVIDELHRTDQQRTPAYEAVSREQTRLRRLLNVIEEADAGQLCVDEGCPHSNIEHVCISARDAVIVKLRNTLDDARCCLDGYYRFESEIDKVLAIPNDDSALQEALKQAKREALSNAAEWFSETEGGADGYWASTILRKLADDLP